MKKRHNLESRRRVFDRWQQSGLAAEEFARQSGVSYSSLCRWRREFDRAAPAFVEVVADHGAADEPVDGGGMHAGVEIAFPTGVVVRVGCEVDEPLLRRVVRAVASS